MFKFVSVIVALAVLGAFASAGTEEAIKSLESKLTKTLEKCEASSGVSSDHLKSLMSGESPLKGKAGCYVGCVAKELDLLKDKNMFDKDKINKLMEPVVAKFKEEKIESLYIEAKKLVEGCLATQQGDDDICVVGKKAAECLLAASKKAGILP